MAWLSLGSGSAKEEPGDIGDDDERDTNSGRDIRLPEEVTSSSSQAGGKGSTPSEVSGGEPWEAAMKSVMISQIKSVYLPVEGGMTSLLKECLIAEDYVKSAVVSGHVDHFESPDDLDLGWGCGWRNIQMLSSFIINEDAEAREVLFGGAKFVPGIPELQRWLEIAWNKGFDESGATSFNWQVLGTMKWIGTTECASLLRSFGVRARVVSFVALRGTEGGIRGNAGSSVQASDDDGDDGDDDPTASFEDYGGSDTGHKKAADPARDGQGEDAERNDDPRSDEGAVEPQGVPQEADKRQLGSSSSKSEARGDTEAENVDDTEEERQGEHAQQDSGKLEEWLRDISLEGSEVHGCGEGKRTEIKDQASKLLGYKHTANELGGFSSSRGSFKNTPEEYIMMDERPTPEIKPREGGGDKSEGQTSGEPIGRCCPMDPKQQGPQEDTNCKTEASDDNNSKRASRESETTRKTALSSGEDDEYKKLFEEAVMFDEGEPHRRVFPDILRGKAGMTRPSRVRPFFYNHEHLVTWILRYFTDDLPEGERLSSQHFVITSKRSPVYFQHEGHSQTIVGIEWQKDAKGHPEDVFFLIFDPSDRSDLLLKTLREKSGWQSFVRYDVTHLSEANYQLCYVDPGLATGDEMEEMKLMKSLRYSYFS